MTNALSLRPGDRVPDFALPGLDGKLRKFIWSFTGNPVALLAVDDLGNLYAGQIAALIAACETSPLAPIVVARHTLAAPAAPSAKPRAAGPAPPLPCQAPQAVPAAP